MRVYELANKLNMKASDLLIELHELGIPATKEISSLSKEMSDEVFNLLSEARLAITSIESKEASPPSLPEVKESPPPPLQELFPPSPPEPTQVKAMPILQLTPTTRMGELSEILKIKSADLIKSLMNRGILVTINQQVTPAVIAAVKDIYRLDFEFSFLSKPKPDEEDTTESLIPRPPIVTIMGHVDHGKTKLLDAIRKTNVVATEAGGITQHIGAYKVKVGNKEIVFLDTPGHEAFTSMRARGVQITDIVVLVVAADDGVMPQTIEAIDHINAAGVPVVVAINKIDLPKANLNQVKQQLSKYDLVPEEWGGKTIFVEVSAKYNLGLDHLLEMLLLEAEMIELKANPNRRGSGVIIEARLDKGRGPVATVLVQNGSLTIGDAFVSGRSYGRIRAMYNDLGERIKIAPPSTPVEVLGFTSMTQPGDLFKVVSNEKESRQLAMQLLEEEASKQKQVERITLEDLYQQIQSGKVKELNIIIKADVSGSIDAAIDVLIRIGSDKVKVKIIHSGVGEVNESDVMLALASNAIIISFHLAVRPEIAALAEKHKVNIRTYNIIYEMTKEVKKALEGLLEPKFKEVALGTAIVREVFRVSKIGLAAGSFVKQGKLVRGEMARLIRKGEVILETKITSLKRFKEDVSEVSVNYECGIGLDGATDIHPDDVIEAYTLEKTSTQL